jgi:RNA polymerase sigma-70 factor (ECF subfamily)
MSREPADEELVRAARSGDLDAFRTLVQRHQARVFSLALRLVRNRAEAEDMTQEAFIRIYRGLPSFRGDSAFTTWMTRVALNTFHRHLSRLPKPAESIDAAAGEERPPLEVADTADGPEAGAAAAQQARRVRHLVARLPSPFRETLTIFYLQERSVEAAAKALGVSTGTLKSRLFRGREMLLRLWQESAGARAADAAIVSSPGAPGDAARGEVRP